MEKKVLLSGKQEWAAPQCKVYGDVEALTLNPGGPGGRGGRGGPGGPGPGGHGNPRCGKICGCSDCWRSFS